MTAARQGVEVTGFDGSPAEGKRYHVDWDLSAAEKGGYDYFMLKEIDEQPQAVATLDRFMKLHPASPALDYALYLKGIVNFNDNLGIFGFIARQDLSQMHFPDLPVLEPAAVGDLVRAEVVSTEGVDLYAKELR